MKYTSEKLENIYTALQTDPNSGLGGSEIIAIQKEKGLNKFDEEKKETALQKIVHHMRDFTTLILLAAAIIAFCSAMFAPDEGDGKSYTDAIVIFAIVVLNVTLAVRQEMGAEKALEALKRMNAQMTVVIRDGQKQTVDAAELVPGDIIVLEAGDMIPADARIIESVNLKVEEAVLTGESVSVEKDANAAVDDKAPLGDQFNMLFSGCLVTNGRARAVVSATGMNTEMGKIAGLLNNTKKVRTPLQKKMDKLCKLICIMALTSGAVLFLLQSLLTNISIWEKMLTAVALAVAAIPEGLPIVVTITLAYGVLTMAKKNAIIRKIPAVESLGSASVICSDKTGTLTMNKMTIKKVWCVNHEPVNTKDEFSHDERVMIEMMGLCSNASIGLQRDGAEGASAEKEVGDPTETAIIRLLRDKHIEKESLDSIHPRVHEIPFDSARKLMTTVHELEEEGRYLSITKGAFDRIPVDATTVCFDTAKKIHDSFADEALRVLAVAYKYYDKLPNNLDVDELERGLTFAGLVGMIDPPRPESIESVRIAKEAGIKTVMITGDHAATASAIAREIGILCEGEKVITGAELAEMTQEELTASVKECSVYARVTPEDKIRIVQAWQSHREIVAMTGDGVNDAPALKAADIGVAMGSGTDVSKNASDMILTDDNFASIVTAVAEGRRVYDNIRKVIISLIPSNISEILAMILGFIVWRATPFAAIQLLFINVVADGIPDLCMCKEPLEDEAMKRKPISKDKSVFAFGLGFRVIIVAILFTTLAMTGYFIGSHITIDGFEPSHEVGRTMAYVTLGWASVVNIINVRSFKKSIFTIGLMSNKLLTFGICLSLTLLAATAALPGIREIFHCVPLSINHWLIMAGLAVTPLIMIEIMKIYWRRKAT
ncbi:MAG: cation-translocating P-type ATPase [Oscillospiraceae bacterium]|jgi:calcium-translocating P-type ATPase|nr:cation-translocating P-type ATPase [Oscillospiraceae bacterium]